MILEFGLTGSDRKQLANIVSETIGIQAQYMYMPTCAYKIGDNYTVTKEGNLEISDNADEKELDNLLEELSSRGYDVPLEEDETGLTVEIPLSCMNEDSIEKLKRIIENKGDLFKSAFQTDCLDIVITDKTIEFPWFTLEQDGDSNAYCTFISMLCDFAKYQKRINNKPETTDNPKYTMRCYLIRLGMVGDEYKSVRKVILRHLTGSAAFRKVVNKDAVSE